MANFSNRLAPLTVSVPVVTAWTSYTPTGNITTNATYTGRWRRVGANIELSVFIIFSGANTQGTFQFSEAAILNGLGLTVDSNALPSTYTDSQEAVGTWSGTDQGVTGSFGGTVARRRSDGAIFLKYSTGLNSSGFVNTSSNAPWTIGANDNVSLSLTLPITGWTTHSPSATTANAVVNGGNSFGGAMLIGTNDAQALNLETNGTTKLSISSAGATSLGIPYADLFTSTSPSFTAHSAIVGGMGTAVAGTNYRGNLILATNSALNTTAGTKGYNRTDTALTGIGISLDTRTSDTGYSLVLSANKVGQAVNTAATVIMGVTAEGTYVVGPATGTTGKHKIQGTNNNVGCIEIVQLSATAGQSYGLDVVGGTNSSDACQRWYSAGGAAELGRVRGNGTWIIGPTGGAVAHTIRGEVSITDVASGGTVLSALATGAGIPGYFKLGNTTNGQQILLFRDSNNSDMGNINRASATTVNYGQGSDARLKTDLGSWSGLDLIAASQPRKYEWHHTPGKAAYGFFAQEFYQNVWDEPVCVGDEHPTEVSKMWSMDYGKITAIAFKAIQELKQELDEAKARIAQLESV